MCELVAAGVISRLRYHDRRQRCASLLMALGLHPRILMETLGPSNRSATMDTDRHLLPALQREAAETMAVLPRRARG